jgi:hypothetical protein
VAALDLGWRSFCIFLPAGPGTPEAAPQTDPHLRVDPRPNVVGRITPTGTCSLPTTFTPAPSTTITSDVGRPDNFPFAPAEAVLAETEDIRRGRRGI